MKLCHLHRYEWTWILSYKVNQKKKNKYCVLCIYVESRKMVQVNLFAKQK